MGVIFTTKKPERVKPPRCTNCNTEPYICETDGDYQCRCIVPWLLEPEGDGKKRRGGPGRLIRVHYKRDGTPYEANFIDGFVAPAPWDALDDDSDIERLISEEWAT